MYVEGYIIQILPIAILALIYAVSGFEFAVVMGLAMIAAGVHEP